MDDSSLPEQDPRPDEDAWEAYLNFVRPFMEASEKTGLENTQLAELETALGAPVPFEVGLLLVMGVPDIFPWRNWQTAAESQLNEWNHQIAQALNVDVEGLSHAPQLLPIYGNIAVPIGPVADASPLFRIDPSGPSLAGLDLADWLHKEFDLPLPWWPENELVEVAFWSERLV